MKVTDKGLILMEVAPGVTVEERVNLTDADLIIADDINEMEI